MTEHAAARTRTDVNPQQVNATGNGSAIAGTLLIALVPSQLAKDLLGEHNIEECEQSWKREYDPANRHNLIADESTRGSSPNVVEQIEDLCEVTKSIYDQASDPLSPIRRPVHRSLIGAMAEVIDGDSRLAERIIQHYQIPKEVVIDLVAYSVESHLPLDSTGGQRSADNTALLRSALSRILIADLNLWEVAGIDIGPQKDVDGNSQPAAATVPTPRSLNDLTIFDNFERCENLWNSEFNFQNRHKKLYDPTDQSSSDTLEVQIEHLCTVPRDCYGKNRHALGMVHSYLAGALLAAANEPRESPPARAIIEYYNVPDDVVHDLIHHVIAYRIGIAAQAGGYLADAEALKQQWRDALVHEFIGTTTELSDVQAPSVVVDDNELRSSCGRFPRPLQNICWERSVSPLQTRFQDIFKAFLGEDQTERLSGSAIETRCHVTERNYDHDKNQSCRQVHSLLAGALSHFALVQSDLRVISAIIDHYEVPDSIVEELIIHVSYHAAGKSNLAPVLQQQLLETFGLVTGKLDPSRPNPSAEGQAGTERVPGRPLSDLIHLNDLGSCYTDFSSHILPEIAADMDVADLVVQLEDLISVGQSGYNAMAGCRDRVHSFFAGALIHYLYEENDTRPARAIIDLYHLDPSVVDDLCTHVANTYSASDQKGAVRERLLSRFHPDRGVVSDSTVSREATILEAAIMPKGEFVPSPRLQDVAECRAIFHIRTHQALADGLIHEICGVIQKEYEEKDYFAERVHEMIVGALNAGIEGEDGYGAANSYIAYYGVDAAVVQALIEIVAEEQPDPNVAAAAMYDELGIDPAERREGEASSAGAGKTETQQKLLEALEQVTGEVEKDHKAFVDDYATYGGANYLSRLLSVVQPEEYTAGDADAVATLHSVITGSLAVAVMTNDTEAALAYSIGERYRVDEEVGKRIVAAVAMWSLCVDRNPSWLLERAELDKDEPATSLLALASGVPVEELGGDKDTASEISGEYVPSQEERKVSACLAEMLTYYDSEATQEYVRRMRWPASKEEYASGDSEAVLQIHRTLVGALAYSVFREEDYWPAQSTIDRFKIDEGVVHALVEVVSHSARVAGKNANNLRVEFGLPGVISANEHKSLEEDDGDGELELAPDPPTPFSPSKKMKDVDGCLSLFEAKYDPASAEEPIAGLRTIPLQDYESETEKYYPELVQRLLVGAMAHSVVNDTDGQAVKMLIERYAISDQVVQSLAEVVTEHSVTAGRNSANLRLLVGLPPSDAVTQLELQFADVDDDAAGTELAVSNDTTDAADAEAAEVVTPPVYLPTARQRDVEGCLEMFARRYTPPFSKRDVRDLCSVGSFQYEKPEHNSESIELVHRFLTGALAYTIYRDADISPVYELIDHYRIEPEVVHTLVDVVSRHALAEQISPENMRLFFGVSGEVPPEAEEVETAALTAQAEDGAFSTEDSALGLDDRFKKVEDAVQVFNRLQNGRGSDEFTDVLFTRVSPNEYVTRAYNTDDVHKFLVGAIVSDGMFVTAEYLANEVAACYQIDEEIVHSLAEDALLYLMASGRKVDGLREALGFPGDIPPVDLIPEACLRGVRKQLKDVQAVEAGLALIDANGIPREVAQPIYVEECWSALLDLRLSDAMAIIDGVPLSYDELETSETGGVDEFLDSVVCNLGVEEKDIPGAQAAFNTIGSALKIDPDTLSAKVSEACTRRVREGKIAAARAITEEFAIDANVFNQAVQGALPGLFFSGKVESALELASEYNLFSSLMEHPEYDRAAKLFMVRRLKGNQWNNNLAALFDTGLMTESVRQDPKVREAVYNRLAILINQNSPDPLQITLLTSVFEMTRPEIVDRTLNRVCRIAGRGGLDRAKKILDAYKISPVAPGYARVKATVSQRVAKTLSVLDYQSAQKICDAFSLKPQDVAEPGMGVIAERVRRGDLRNAENLARWLKIDPGALYNGIEPADIRSALLASVRCGWSEEVERLAILCSDAKKSTLLQNVPRRLVGECLAADIRAARWEALAAAQEAFNVEEQDLRSIALDQIEDVLATGDARRVSDIFDHFDLNPDEFLDRGLEAAVRAYQLSDLKRVDEIVKAIPSVKSALDEARTCSRVVQAYGELIAGGWKGTALKHFRDTFGLKHEKLDQDWFAGAVRSGVQNELNQKELDFALKVVDDLDAPVSWFLEAILEADESVLDRSASDELQEFARALIKREGALLKVLDADQRSSVLESIDSRIQHRERSTPFRIGHFFDLDDDAVDMRVAKQAFRMIQPEDFKAGLELLRYYNVNRSLKLDEALEDPAGFREQLSVPEKVTTTGGAIEFFYSQSGGEPKEEKTQPADYVAPPTKEALCRQRAIFADQIMSGHGAVHSKTPVPHYKQQTGHTCGPASARMALEAAVGILYPEDQVAEWLGTNSDIGTPLNHFGRLSMLFPDVETRIAANGDLDQLRGLLEQGYTIIVNYHIGIEPHYGVVKCIGNEGVVLSDPNSGPFTGLPYDQFDWRGGYENARVRGGFIAIRERATSVVEVIADESIPF